jgi:hypothetical protein
LAFTEKNTIFQKKLNLHPKAEHLPCKFAQSNKQSINMNKQSSIFFSPWEGNHYNYGIAGFDSNGHIIYGTESSPGKKVLILGDSHYCSKPDEAIPELTRNIIKDYIDPATAFEYYKNTYTKFGRSLAGYAIDKLETIQLWEHVVFYNYVQEPLSQPRQSPTSQQFANAETAFWEVVNRYNPDYIIVWGARLYKSLPQKGRQGKDLEVDNGWSETWIFDPRIIVMPIIHPSSPQFSWEYTHRFIAAMFTL